MAKITTAQIEEALQNLIDPISGKDVVSAQMVKGLQIRDGHVAFTLEVDPAKGSEMEPLRKQAEETVFALDGVLTATVVLTSEKKGESGGHSHDHDHGHKHNHRGHGHRHGDSNKHEHKSKNEDKDESPHK